MNVITAIFTDFVLHKHKHGVHALRDKRIVVLLTSTQVSVAFTCNSPVWRCLNTTGAMFQLLVQISYSFIVNSAALTLFTCAQEAGARDTQTGERRND